MNGFNDPRRSLLRLIQRGDTSPADIVAVLGTSPLDIEWRPEQEVGPVDGSVKLRDDRPQVTLVANVGDRGRIVTIEITYDVDHLRDGRATITQASLAEERSNERSSLGETDARRVGRALCRFDLERLRPEREHPVPPAPDLMTRMDWETRVIRDELISFLVAEAPLVTTGRCGRTWGERVRRHDAVAYGFAPNTTAALDEAASLGMHPNDLRIGPSELVGGYPGFALLVAEQDTNERDVLMAMRAFSGERIVLVGHEEVERRNEEARRLLAALEEVARIDVTMAPLGLGVAAVFERRFAGMAEHDPGSELMEASRGLSPESELPSVDSHLLALQAARCNARRELMRALDQSGPPRDLSDVAEAIEFGDMPDDAILEQLGVTEEARNLAELAEEAKRVLAIARQLSTRLAS